MSMPQIFSVGTSIDATYKDDMNNCSISLLFEIREIDSNSVYIVNIDSYNNIEITLNGNYIKEELMAADNTLMTSIKGMKYISLATMDFETQICVKQNLGENGVTIMCENIPYDMLDFYSRIMGVLIFHYINN